MSTIDCSGGDAKSSCIKKMLHREEKPTLTMTDNNIHVI